MKIEKKTLMGLFIAFIMIFSVFGVLFYGFNQQGEERKQEYKGREFVYKGREFVTKIDDKEIGFLRFPTEIEDMKIDNKSKQLLNEYAFTVTYDSKSQLASEMATVQFKLFEERLKPFKKYIQRALTNSTLTNLAEVQCADATEKNPVIMLEYGNETSITAEGNCIIAKGNSAIGIYEVSDRIVYQMLGVMQ